ncbi:MAG: radical SAM family heme chaperone HemW [Anaerolineales bacterium]
MPTSLYLHIPFCRHRCAYCDFNTYAGLDELKPAYVGALIREIQGVGRLAQTAGKSRSVHTLFFGGGTPSLLSQKELAGILSQVRESFELSAEAEITLEANPGTLDLPRLTAMREQGVNRLSLGMQSSDAVELRMLERQHGMEQVRQAVSWARLAGFDNLNLDLIYGLPTQDLLHWEASLKSALALEPEHLSLYALSLEFGTPMRKWVEDGRLPWPDPDLAADMYELADELLARVGYMQYEISNWARPGPDGQPLACSHNLQIWRTGEYLGFGAGAHGCADGWRTRAARSPRAYVERLTDSAWTGPYPFSPATSSRELQEPAQVREDMLILGLRLTREGVSEARYRERFDRTLQDDFGAVIDDLLDAGLLEKHAWGIRLAPRGRLLGNQVFQRFVACLPREGSPKISNPAAHT